MVGAKTLHQLAVLSNTQFTLATIPLPMQAPIPLWLSVDKMSTLQNVKLTKCQVDKIWWTGKLTNVKLTKCQVDKMSSWQNVKLTKCQVDKMASWQMASWPASWQNVKLAKWQVGKMTSWQNDKLTKCQVGKMACCHNNLPLTILLLWCATL